MSRVVTPVDGRMPLVEHLRELRGRLAKSLLAITVGIVVAFIFWEPILTFLKQPLCDAAGNEACQLYAFGPLEAFAIKLKTSSIAGVVLTAPIWLYQFGAFITPALHKKERRYAAGFVTASTVLFAGGCVVAYLTLDKGLSFLLDIGGDDVTTLPGIKSYLNFVVLSLLAFGIAFLFPVVLVFLNIAGVLPAAKMRAWRRGMIVGIAVLAAVLTPSTDPYSFAFMAVPLYGLYEICILIARVRERAVRRRLAADPVASLGDDETSALDPAPPGVDPVALDSRPAPLPAELDASEQAGRASLRG
jgi:sec-independent protein translocase protein TatC